MAEIRAHIRVSGRVQGVGFRYFVMRTAKFLRLTGWVKNTRDGGVEIVAEGREEMVSELIRILPTGNTMARVANVSVHRFKPDFSFDDFTIEY